MVEFRYFNKEYKNVADKTFSESIVFFKDNWDDYGYYITLLFMSIAMIRSVVKDI
ncbi:Uncharacterised protein [Streptococcus pneumoniae]|nr:Uncharacterised protein [Streptococcus pneumoniae]